MVDLNPISGSQYNYVNCQCVKNQEDVFDYQSVDLQLSQEFQPALAHASLNFPVLGLLALLALAAGATGCSDSVADSNDSGLIRDGGPADFTNPDGITCKQVPVKLDENNVEVKASGNTSFELKDEVLRFFAKGADSSNYPSVFIAPKNSNSWQLNSQSQLTFEISSDIKITFGTKARPKLQLFFSGNNSAKPDRELNSIPDINIWTKQKLVIPVGSLPKKVARIRFFVETDGADVEVSVKNISFNCGQVSDAGIGDQGVQPDLVRIPDTNFYMEQGAYDVAFNDGYIVDQGFSDGVVIIDQGKNFPDYLTPDSLKADTTATPSGQLITGTPTYVHNMNANDSANWLMANWVNGSPFDVIWKPGQISFAGGFMTINLNKCLSACQGYTYESGEYRTIKQVYTNGKFEARMKGAQGSGLVSAFFIWGSSKDEVDIVEILGKDCKGFQTNYYLKGVGGHETMIYPGGSFDACKDFHNYGVHKTASSIKYYVDGKLVLTALNSSSTPLPTQPGHMMFNLWATDSTLYSWAGKPSFTPPVKALVDWVKYVKP